jgi:hypothetical protein
MVHDATADHLISAQNASQIDRVVVTAQLGGWAMSHYKAFGEFAEQYNIWRCGDGVWQWVNETQQLDYSIPVPPGVYTALGITCPQKKMTAPAAHVPYNMPTTTTTPLADGAGGV